MTAPAKVYAGQETPNVDAGVKQAGTASLGDTVWFDTDKDGTLDAGELGAEGVQVSLSGAGADGRFGTADDVARATTTDANGNYLFDNLDAGDYKVTFGSLENYVFTKEGYWQADRVNNDSDAGVGGVTDVINLSEGEAERDVDAGLIFVDPATASLGDTVWFDTNNNGVLDAGESGAADVNVKLTGAGVDGVFGTKDDISKTTTTDANGKYLFDKLNAGDYKVTFGTVAGHTFTTAGAAADDAVNNDSDAGSGGMTDVVNLSVGEAERDVDAGLVKGNNPEICAQVVITRGGKDVSNQSHSEYNDNISTIKVVTDAPVSEDTTFTVSLENGSASYGSDFWFGYYNDSGYEKSKTAEVTIKAGESTGTLKGEFLVIFREHRSVNYDSSTETFKITLDAPKGNHIDTFKCLDGLDAKILDSPLSPVALDLNMDGKIGVTGATTSADKAGLDVAAKTVGFDMDADGDMDQIEWLAGDGDAFLFDNRDGNAINDMNGSRLFGDTDDHANGYAKMAELDADGDGMLRNTELAGLQLWVDNGDAVMTQDEIVMLSDAGIVALSTDMEVVKDADDRDLMQSVAELSNGGEMLTEDVWFMQA